jgi:cholest-4-en-3-one 26-monooxygenase
VIPEGFDFTDPGLYEHRVPTEELAELRRTAPVWWNKQPRGIAAFDDEGFWVVTRHADVMEVSRNTDVFSSWENTAIIRFHPEKMDRERIEWQRFIMLNTDPPHHTQLRAIVSRGFTPRAVTSLRDALATKAEKIVKGALEKGEWRLRHRGRVRVAPSGDRRAPWGAPRRSAQDFPLVQRDGRL